MQSQRLHCCDNPSFSPYSGSTVGNLDSASICGHGADQGFFYELLPGHAIHIGQATNTFNSMHTLRVGGLYPGERNIACEEVNSKYPDYADIEHINNSSSTQMIYFVIDVQISGSPGDFVLEWEVFGNGEC